MDIEKLIDTLKQHGVSCVRSYGKYCSICDEAATALSTLQDENAKLRGKLEYEQEHANAYYEECGQWEAENTQLKEKLEALKQDRDAIEQDFRAFAKQWWEQDSKYGTFQVEAENNHWIDAPVFCLNNIINHPENIVRKPRFTQQEVEDAKAVRRVFGRDGTIERYSKAMTAPYSNLVFDHLYINEDLFPSIQPGQPYTLDEIIGGAE